MSISSNLQASLPARLKEARLACKLTQAQLAELTHRSLRSIAAYETGASTIPSDTIYAFQEAGLDMAYVLFARRHSGDGINKAWLERAITWADQFCVDEKGRQWPPEHRVQWIQEAYVALAEGIKSEMSAMSADPQRIKAKARGGGK